MTTPIQTPLIVRLLTLLPDSLLWIIASFYIAGATREQALARALKLRDQYGDRCKVVLDYLGEKAPDEQYADAYAKEVDDLLHAVAGYPWANVSCKLSGFGTLLNADRAWERVHGLLSKRDTFIRFDAEEIYHPDNPSIRIHNIDLSMLDKLHQAGLSHCGGVLQCRNYRVETDLKLRLSHLPDFRFCIGAYDELSMHAYQNKPDMKDNLCTQATIAWQAGCSVRIASHDTSVVHRMLAVYRQAPPQEGQIMEIQWLMGVPIPTGLMEEVFDAGLNWRFYVAYGPDWRAYAMRRFARNPQMIFYIIKNLLVLALQKIGLK